MPTQTYLNLPKEKQEPIRNFFHSYKETINIKPASGEEQKIGGGKKKRSRNFFTIVTVLLSASVERFSVSRMRELF